MKVSLNWAQQFSNVDLKKISTDELLKKIGAQLGAVESVEDWSNRFEGIVIAKVITCEKHPNADKLSLCTVDDGGSVQGVERNKDGHVQVVCGAPNVRAGLTVAWLPPGITVPASLDKDPFTLEVREIRGQVSNGMLASAAELGISDDHSGIVELDLAELAEGTKLGDSLTSALWLDGEVVIDCENKMFTHRPDCFGILGVARELAGIQGMAFKSPDWYLRQPSVVSTDSLPLTVQVADPQLVPRFMVVGVKNVEVKPSPLHMQYTLKRVGIKPINNIVDVTNYVMYLTGQPLHAYDYDKVKERSGPVPTLIARRSHKGEKVHLLNDKTVEFSDDSAVVIATDKEVVGVGGVMGGADTEVDGATKNIILEVASFEMYNIRRTSMKYGLFTDAVTRFNKGQSPLQNDRVLAYALKLINELSGGQAASKVYDVNQTVTVPGPVVTTAQFINSRLGSNLTAAEIQNLLQNVELSVSVDKDTIEVQPPFWRTDLELPEDIVEEVGRLYGFDKLPTDLPKRSGSPVQRNAMLDLKGQLRQILAAAGASEVLTYSFVHGDLLQKVGQDPLQAFELGNALSPDLQYYRLSLTPSLFDKVYSNVRAGYEELAIFELGKAHNKLHATDDDGLPKEFSVLSLVYSASDRHKKAYSGAAYYQARYYLQYLASRLGLDLVYEALSTKSDALVAQPFEYRRSALVKDRASGTVVGIVGEPRSVVRRNLKLPDFTAAFEIDLEELLKLIPSHKPYQALFRFPSSTQDMSFKVPAELSFGQLESIVGTELQMVAKQHGYQTSLRPLDIYQPDDTVGTKHFAVRISLTHPERTLTTAEVNTVTDSIAAKVQSTLGAERI